MLHEKSVADLALLQKQTDIAKEVEDCLREEKSKEFPYGLR